MEVAPADLPVSLVRDALRDRWGVEATEVTYAPVGFGSHHWHVRAVDGRRWFATADRLGADGADGAVLTASLRTAAVLRSAGLEFVVAPVPDRDGAVLPLAGERYGLALYPHVTGRSGSPGSGRTRVRGW